MDIIKRIRGSDENCARCHKKLGLRKETPSAYWDYKGKLCKDCFDFILPKAHVFEAEYKEGFSDWTIKIKGGLSIQNFDDRRRVLFVSEGGNYRLEIPVSAIQKREIIDYEDESTKKKIMTMGISRKSSTKHLQITFLDDSSKMQQPIFNLKETQGVFNALHLLILQFEKGKTISTPDPDVVNAIKKVTGQDLQEESTLGQLFDKHGEINKIMKLLEPNETVLFVTRQSRIMPGGSVIFTPSTIFATDRRLLIRNPTMMGLRSAVEDIPYDSISSVKLQVGVFTSTLVFTGPGFGEVNRISQYSLVRAWGRDEEGAIDAIPKKDAEQLLMIIKKRMAISKGAKVSFTQIVNQNPSTETVQQKVVEDDALTILKKRLAKGEISKEEFEDLKKTLE